jgi:GNAT superfamily N-acetyltransferase
MIAAPATDAMLRDDTEIIQRPGWYQIITPSSPASCNEVVHSALAADEVERVIAEVERTYGERGLAAKWLTEPSTRPTDLAARLEARGWTAWDLRGMAVDTARELGPVGQAREVEADALDGFLAAMLEGWQLPSTELALERATHLRELARQPRRAHFFAAWAKDRIVGTAGLILHPDFAYLVGGQVLASARGQGLYRQLVAARLRFLRQLGIELAVTYAREATSAPMLEHLGFETLFRSRCALRRPGDPPRPADCPPVQGA